jgi:hypothetical protein
MLIRNSPNVFQIRKALHRDVDRRIISSAKIFVSSGIATGTLNSEDSDVFCSLHRVMRGYGQLFH